MNCKNCGDPIESCDHGWRHVNGGLHACDLAPVIPGAEPEDPEDPQAQPN